MRGRGDSGDGDYVTRWCGDALMWQSGDAAMAAAASGRGLLMSATIIVGQAWKIWR